jgi:DNA polymerase bacteriophage-type
LTQKQVGGKALIKMFADASRPETPQSHPEDWERFRSYARDDVASMRDVFFATMPLHRRMWAEYWASERINHRGVPVDLAFVRGAAALAKRLTDTANDDIMRLTGKKIRTVNQNKALLDWIRYELRHLPEVDRLLTKEFEIEEDEEGERVSVPKYSLGRGLVEALIAYLEHLDDTEGLTDAEWVVLQVLEVRLYGASATPKKYQKILDSVDSDGRLKGQYVFCGASATTRYSSRGTQIHNLSRSTVGSRQDEIEAIEMISDLGDRAYAPVQKRFGYVGKALSYLIRPTFLAPEGETFCYSDWASVEAVVCPWLTDDADAEPLLDAIRANHADPSKPDMYKVQAAKMLGKRPEDVTKSERQAQGKTVQLACQYLGGVGSLHNMGRIYRVSFTDDEGQDVVDRWRAENVWATRFGDRIWEAVLWCMENPGLPKVAGRLTFVYDAAYRGGTLFMVLPNGDPLLYTGIKWREVKVKDKQTGEEKVETRLTVWKGRGVSPIWKGELVNNATQGTSAALLRHVLRVVEQDGRYPVVFHTHDEVGLCVPVQQAEAARDYLVGVMQTRPEWAPGLPLKADPVISEFYTKTED